MIFISLFLIIFLLRRYLADEEARKRGHIVLRLPPYHCQYNPIELAWGIMKRHYDKHTSEASSALGEYSDEKCLNLWTATLDLLTPEVWKKLADKVDRMILADWEDIRKHRDCDKTDYETLVINPNDSSDSEFEEDEDFYDPRTTASNSTFTCIQTPKQRQMDKDKATCQSDNACTSEPVIPTSTGPECRRSLFPPVQKVRC